MANASAQVKLENEPTAIETKLEAKLTKQLQKAKTELHDNFKEMVS